MEIRYIKAKNDGYINCKSNFYSAQNVMHIDDEYVFTTGINELVGEIDSGVWGISYLLSMYRQIPEDFILFNPLEAIVNGDTISLYQFVNYSCYMDMSCEMFSDKKTVRQLVLNGLSCCGEKYSAEDIRNLFFITKERFDRPISGVGNEVFKAMSAIGFSYDKQVYCFPWFSKMRFNAYHSQLTSALKVLESLKKTVILPIGK